MKLNRTVLGRPEPRFDAFHVLNRERLVDFESLPAKFPQLSEAQFYVLGLLYHLSFGRKTASLTQLGTNFATGRKMVKLGLIALKGENQQRASITYFGRRTYEVLYWQQAERLEGRQEKARAVLTGKHHKM